MSTLEQYLEALIAKKTQAALDSLNPTGPQCTEYHFGFVCGVQAGLRIAEELLNQKLEDPEDGDDSRSPKARRSR